MPEVENVEEISDELTAKLIHFHEVTQIEDLDRCRTILRQHNWNVELAVQSTFSDNSNNTPQSSSSPSPEPMLSRNDIRRRVLSPTRTISSHQHIVPRPMIYVGQSSHRPPEGIFGWGYYLFLFPIRFTINQVFGIIRFVFRLFFPDPRERITDPHGDVISFINEFQEKYPTHPTFYRGTYGNARDEAKRQIRFLLVYLHDPNHEATDSFCQNTLCHQNSIEFINDKVIFWGCSITKPEGYKVSKIIRNPSYPLLALICLYQNQMSVIGRLQGHVTSDELITRLTEMMDVYEPTLISARADKDARNQNIRIREEQDAAYLISLQKDQEKMDKKRKEEEQERRLTERKEMMKQEKEFKKKLCLDRKARCREEILPEPVEADVKIIELVIKLPNGSRLKRKFKATDTVKTLHDFIYAHDDAPPSFQVFSNFPRRLLPGCTTSTIDEADAKHPTLEEIGFNKQDTLFVQTLHTDDEETDEDEDHHRSS